MKAGAGLKRVAEGAIDDRKRAKTIDDLSPIEQLPPELLRKVLHGAPEAVSHLHKVCVLLLLQ